MDSCFANEKYNGKVLNLVGNAILTAEEALKIFPVDGKEKLVRSVFANVLLYNISFMFGLGNLVLYFVNRFQTS